MEDTESIQTVGRRKEAVARVIMRSGDGEWEVNGQAVSDHFPLLRHQQAIERPLKVVESEGIYDIQLNVNGGGLTGQAEAAQLGIARALVEADEDNRKPLRDEGLLTRDPRTVERKKPGQPKARKKSQFSKR
ncbi:MAG: 30S ribosomal protein S9 [Candidatus Palauibacterales bacterium]|nr:30S ribosomal protein S9 [Candidatus Palauibacterales bacterium]